MSRPPIPGRRSLWQVWRWPTALALASAVGLVSALVGDGGRDVLSWVALALPALVVAAALVRGRRRR